MKRRTFLQSNITAGSLAMPGWLSTMGQVMAQTKTDAKKRPHACIILWMSGGPSQTDTFDMKPKHENGGEFSEVATNVPGIRFSEHLPELAKQADKLAIVRTLNSKEGDHERGSYLLQTGQKLGGPVKHPALRSMIGHQLAPERATLPPLVSIKSNGFLFANEAGPGFLGPRFRPLNVSTSSGASPGSGLITSITGGADIHTGTPATLAVNSLSRFSGIEEQRWQRRLKLWGTFESQFIKDRNSPELTSHQATYKNAQALMTSDQAEAFDLSSEPAALRAKYGVGTFGQGCLMARRLVEAGVSCVEVSLSSSTLGGQSWDSHSDNFTAVQNLSLELDAGFAALLADLDSRGLLETTTVVCMGEFGRTPSINSAAGRDHFPGSFFGVLAGGKTAAGQTYGRTSDSGMQIVENPVTIPEWLATICAATNIEPSSMIENESGRPVPLVDADPIGELIV